MKFAASSQRSTDTIIFLDFDGVCHPVDERDMAHADNMFTCTRHLWDILRQHPDVRIVFSTNWRLRHTLDELVQFVTAGGGEDLVDRFIGVTPTLAEETYPQRLRECGEWLAKNATGEAAWLIIDDTPGQVGFAASPNVYVVDYRTGLKEADIGTISAKLRAQKS